ncbi:hypothetical protein [Acidilobus sp. 7A]|uniref:hypothetical protein n=1 Tax=Acidilobus sp. 7A TaxID=1577685 RepID=UPI000764DEA8|nr:hypothetical protein [Acidilobus sp. 7A]AMD30723.1 hypothetical protein SE86_04735 [Acidilobus sp. 7A]
MTDVNGNTEKGVENELKKLSDNFYKAGRQRLHTLILAIVSLTVSALSSSSPSRALNALTQFTSFVLLFYAFLHGLNVDTSLISILHDAVLLNLKRGVTVKALGSSNEQTSTPSRQPGSTLSNRLARLTRDPDLILRLFLASYIIEFIGLFNIIFNLITRVSGLSIQLQPLLSAFSMIVPISASILLGLSQWSVSTAVRGSLESSCTSAWLEMLKEVRVLLFATFMSILFIYVYSFYLIPMSLTPSTRASYILGDSFYFGSGLGLLASLAFLLMLLTLIRDFIHLVCSREQTQENKG